MKSGRFNRLGASPSPACGRGGKGGAISFLLALAVTALVVPAHAEERRIALTFDDSPTLDSAMMTGAERTDRLLAGLKKADVAQAAFFIFGKNVEAEGGAPRVAAFGEAGHVLANHSWSHAHLRDANAQAYLADIDRNEALLARFENRRPWYRFPFLDEGADEEQRDAVREGLKQRGLSNGYVTVDTYDWYLAGLMDKAAIEGRCFDTAALRALYVEMVAGSADFYDALALKTLGRSPAHVVLLHENDLAALYVEDLAKALRAQGWTIVTADEAFADPLAASEPATMFLSQGRISAIAREQGAPPEALVNKYEDRAMLDARFAEAATPCEKAAP